MAGILFHFNVEKEEWKLDSLLDLYEAMSNNQTPIVIFVNTGDKVDRLAAEMRGRGHTISATHQGMDQSIRDVVMAEFRAGSSRGLIATDLLAPCIDDVLHACLDFNYEMPTRPETCLGRVNFFTREDEGMLSDIRKLYNDVVIRELPDNVAALLY